MSSTLRKRNVGSNNNNDHSPSSSPTRSNSSNDSYTKIDDNDEYDNDKQHSRTMMASPTTTSLARPTLHSIKAKLKEWLSFYVRYTSTLTGQDNILKVCQYSLWFIARYYFAKRKSGSSSESNSNTTFLYDGINKLSEQLCWARYVNRLFGLPMSVDGCLDNSWGPGIIGQLLSLTMVGYYPTEAIAWLKWQAPTININSILSSFIPLFGRHRRRRTTTNNHGSGMKWDDVASSPPLIDEATLASKASAWSCRFWFLYIVIDILKSIKTIREEQVKTKRLTPDTTHGSGDENGSGPPTTIHEVDESEDDDHDDHDNNHDHSKVEVASTTITTTSKTVIRMEKLQLIRNILFLLPSIHWSLDKWDTQPWLNNDLVNNLMLLETFVSLYQSMTKFATNNS